jgi:hypothetical protein
LIKAQKGVVLILTISYTFVSKNKHLEPIFIVALYKLFLELTAVAFDLCSQVTTFLAKAVC